MKHHTSTTDTAGPERPRGDRLDAPDRTLQDHDDRADLPPLAPLRRALIVLADDSVICEDCHEPSGVELSPARVPFARTTIGICQCCGAIGVDGAEVSR